MQFVGNGRWKTAFKVISKHSAPEVVVRQQTQPFEPPYSHDSHGPIDTWDRTALEVSFLEKIEDDGGVRPEYTWATKKILRDMDNYLLAIPGETPRLISQEFAHLVNPFFFQDRHHTFYVEPTLTEKTFVEWEDWIIGVPGPEIEIDDIVMFPNVPEWVDPGGPVEFDPLSDLRDKNTCRIGPPHSKPCFSSTRHGWETGGVNVKSLPAMDKTMIDTIGNIDSNFMPTMIGAGGLHSMAINKHEGQRH